MLDTAQFRKVTALCPDYIYHIPSDTASAYTSFTIFNTACNLIKLHISGIVSLS